MPGGIHPAARTSIPIRRRRHGAPQPWPIPCASACVSTAAPSRFRQSRPIRPMSPRRRPARKRASPPSPSRAAWMTARARNALRRPVFIGAISVVTFIASLVALIVVPQQAKRAANAIRPAPEARPDTLPTMNSLLTAERQVAAADSALVATRAQLTQLIAATAAAAASDTTSTGEAITTTARNRRDSLAGEIDQLDRLLARADNAPLLGSYRALAEAAPMQGDPQVKVLLD